MTNSTELVWMFCHLYTHFFESALKQQDESTFFFHVRCWLPLSQLAWYNQNNFTKCTRETQFKRSVNV